MGKNACVPVSLLLCSIAFLIGCAGNPDTANQLSPAEKKAGWLLLFNGKSLDGWHLYNDREKTASSEWKAENGALVCDTLEALDRGDLVSDQEFGNYDLKFEWQLQEKGNSGVFINVLEQPGIATAWLSGPEYQLLDSAHIDYPKPEKRSGCLYGFAPQENPVANRPLGEWNRSEIIQKNGAVHFYLNGVCTYAGDFSAPAWKDQIAKTHFKDYPFFGQRTSGHIALQDWHSKGLFRNIKIKRL